MLKIVEYPYLFGHMLLSCKFEWLYSSCTFLSLNNFGSHFLLLQVVDFVKRNVGSGTYKPLLAGNSVYVDFLFIKVT